MSALDDFLTYDLPVLGVKVENILVALLILILGWLVVRIIVSIFKKSLRKAKLPQLLVDFLGKFLSSILYVAVILMVASNLGLAVGSVFIGLSAIIGLILAFGMQDTLNNILAGVWIASLRPIDKDEVVSVNGLKGKVLAVGIMSTELLTPDNTYITIPNKSVWGAPIINDTRMPQRRVDVNVGIAYGSSISEAVSVAMGIMKRNRMVLNEPPPDVVVTDLGDSAINLQLRAWTKTENYWDLRGALTKKVPLTFEAKGIEIPFPQMDVHMKDR
ncbi:MAG: mechanosensitive ion channel family protein [Thermoplasmatota archaeon]